MQWQSATDFFAMGGYGLYVWGSVGMCALVMLAEWVFLRSRTRKAWQQLQARRET